MTTETSAPTQTPPQWQPPTPMPAAAPKKLAPPTLFQAASAVATIVALILTTNGQQSWYEQTPAWAIFATIAAVVQLAPALSSTTGWSAERSWTIGAVAVGGLFAWWVLIALPSVSTNQGFVATMAVGAALLGAWLAPGRRL